MKERSNLSKSRRSCIKRGVVFGERLSYRGGNVAQVVEHRTGTPLIQVQFPDAARHFSPRVNFQRRLFYSVRTFLCAVACLNSCAHIRDPVVHVRVQWIMETLKHPAYIVVWAVWLRRSWISLGKATWISYGRNPIGTIQLLKKKKGRVFFLSGVHVQRNIRESFWNSGS